MAKVAIHAGGAKAEREGHNPRDCDGSGQQHPGNAHGPRQLRRARTEADGTGQLQRPCDRYGERQRRFLWTERELWLENLMEEQERAKEKGSGEDRTALLRLPGEMAKLHQDPMLFSNDIFFIEPKLLSQASDSSQDLCPSPFSGPQLLSCFEYSCQVPYLHPQLVSWAAISFCPCFV
ncbi:uncharacterized protein GJ701_016090 isoform 2-T2 [Geothlypis trichas]